MDSDTPQTLNGKTKTLASWKGLVEPLQKMVVNILELENRHDTIAALGQTSWDNQANTEDSLYKTMGWIGHMDQAWARFIGSDRREALQSVLKWCQSRQGLIDLLADI